MTLIHHCFGASTINYLQAACRQKIESGSRHRRLCNPYSVQSRNDVVVTGDRNGDRPRNSLEALQLRPWPCPAAGAWLQRGTGLQRGRGCRTRFPSAGMSSEPHPLRPSRRQPPPGSLRVRRQPVAALAGSEALDSRWICYFVTGVRRSGPQQLASGPY